VESAARNNGGARITRMCRAAILGLKKVDVTAAGYIERVTMRTDHSAGLARERCFAIADSAEESGPLIQLTIMRG